MSKRDRISSISLLILSIAICIGASRLHMGSFNNPGSGFFLFFLGAVVGGLSLVLFIKTFFEGGTIAETSKPKEGGAGKLKVFLILGALAAYALFLDRLGFTLTTFLLFILLLKGVHPQKWTIALGGALAASLGSYAIFQLGLNVQLPRGFFGM